MSSYTIGEVANRSGFTASALRYYEGIGLVAPSARTGAGYRLYDDRALSRLAFIARAKQLGCSLDEITDLVSVWGGARCAPVQQRFHGLVTDKLFNARRQITELTAFTAQLQAAASQLGREPADGPCSDDCACVTDRSEGSGASVLVNLTSEADHPPIACTLEPGAMADRLVDWQAVLDHAVTRATTPDGALRVEFDDGLDLGQLARLVAAEQRCCAFLSFAITVDPRGVALEVRAPVGATDVVTSIFGRPA